MDAEQVKEMLYSLGADLCGIASIDRFSEAPKGFHPKDVLPNCKSVVVIANRFAAGTLACNSTVPYTVVRNILSNKMDEMAVKFCTEVEKQGIISVPTGTIGPTEFDKDTQRYRNIVSAKHCAQLAGLGVIGKNTLLITPEFGNMVWLSVILMEIELKADKLIENSFCNNCNLCIKACPVQALVEPEMKQLVCFEYAFGEENGGDWRIKCHKCRDICPHCYGKININMKRNLFI
jgi:epoxyqueuosine reductase QueG